MTTERTTTGTAYADRVLHEMKIAATCGLDPDQAREVAGSLLAGLAKMAKALEEATYAPGEYEKIARSRGARAEGGGRAGAADGVRLGPAGLAGGHGNRLAAGAHERAVRDRLGLDRGGRRGGEIGRIARRRRRGASDLRATFCLPRRERVTR